MAIREGLADEYLKRECEIKLNYEAEYCRLQELYKKTLDENEQLKKALLKIALKL